MKERFEGTAGRRRLVEALVLQKLVGAQWELAEVLANTVELLELESGATLIEQGGKDTDCYLIITGSFDVLVHGRPVAVRQPGRLGRRDGRDPTDPGPRSVGRRP